MLRRRRRAGLSQLFQIVACGSLDGLHLLSHSGTFVVHRRRSRRRRRRRPRLALLEEIANFDHAWLEEHIGTYDRLLGMLEEIEQTPGLFVSLSLRQCCVLHLRLEYPCSIAHLNPQTFALLEAHILADIEQLLQGIDNIHGRMIGLGQRSSLVQRNGAIVEIKLGIELEELQQQLTEVARVAAAEAQTIQISCKCAIDAVLGDAYVRSRGCLHQRTNWRQYRLPQLLQEIHDQAAQREVAYPTSWRGIRQATRLRPAAYAECQRTHTGIQFAEHVQQLGHVEASAEMEQDKTRWVEAEKEATS